jgi:hypothetical protein
MTSTVTIHAVFARRRAHAGCSGRVPDIATQSRDEPMSGLQAIADRVEIEGAARRVHRRVDDARLRPLCVAVHAGRRGADPRYLCRARPPGGRPSQGSSGCRLSPTTSCKPRSPRWASGCCGSSEGDEPARHGSLSGSGGIDSIYDSLKGRADWNTAVPVPSVACSPAPPGGCSPWQPASDTTRPPRQRTSPASSPTTDHQLQRIDHLDGRSL